MGRSGDRRAVRPDRTALSCVGCALLFRSPVPIGARLGRIQVRSIPSISPSHPSLTARSRRWRKSASSSSRRGSRHSSAGKSLRDTGWAAHKAARDAGTAAAGDAARAAMCAASAAYLHPLADAHQVKHILGAAAHAARAAELMAGGDRDVGADHIEQARRRATPVVVDVLSRYPAAPPGGGRVGELLRDLDEALRSRF